MDRRIHKEIDLDTGVIVKEVYKLGRLRHRDPNEGPADIWRDAKTGQVIHASYYSHGRLHRLDGPAYWAQNPDKGFVTVEEYWQRGRQHRDSKEGPADIRRDWETGALAREYYYVNGDIYRDPAEGPSVIEYDVQTGQVISESYSDPDEAPEATHPPQRSAKRARPSKTL